MIIKVDKYVPQDDGGAILQISYDDEFAEHAIKQFVLWSIERLVEEMKDDNSLPEEG